MRQPFSESEIGLYKATVLATRINLFWGLGWRGMPCFVDERWSQETDIVIGCVDSRAARHRDHPHTNLLELPLLARSGQQRRQRAVCSGTARERQKQVRRQRLPTASELFPELVDSKLDRKDKLPSCSAVEALERQEPFVNHTLAYQAMAMLARLFRYGKLSYHGGFVNLRNGRTVALPVDPAVWARMGIRRSTS